MLYDENFLATIPPPRHQERQPLVNLKVTNPRALEILDAWYEELFPQGSQDLFMRLRDFRDAQNFIGAFWELVIYRCLLETGHNVQYNVTVGGKTPDLYWPDHDLIGDVVAISDPFSGSVSRKHLDQLVTMVDSEDLPFDLVISEFWFREGSNPRLAPIIAWLHRLRDLPSADLFAEAQEYEAPDAKLEVLLRERTIGPRVKAMGGVSLDATQMRKVIKGRLRQKLRTYGRPMVVFVGQGLGFWTPDRDAMNMALYGDWLVHFSRVPGQEASGPDTAANGIFYNRIGHSGRPANTNLSAAILATRLQRDDRLGVWMGAFHNPEAIRPLPQDFFAPMAQFLVTGDSGGECTLSWINENNGILLGDPLPPGRRESK